MKQSIMFTVVLAMLVGIGCAGIDIARDPLTGMQMVNQYDRTAFGTNVDRREYFKCDPETEELAPEQVSLKTSGKNCKLIDTKFTAVSGTVNQLAMPVSVVIGSALIGDGIKNSGDNIESNSSQSNANINGSGNGNGQGRGRGRGRGNGSGAGRFIN